MNQNVDLINDPLFRKDLKKSLSFAKAQREAIKLRKNNYYESIKRVQSRLSDKVSYVFYKDQINIICDVFGSVSKVVRFKCKVKK